jgi:hypothetical protein
MEQQHHAIHNRLGQVTVAMGRLDEARQLKRVTLLPARLTSSFQS